MSAPAEMPHADEALKALVARFKDVPDSSFIELAAALLARGHAAEALRVAEHGLQLVPGSVDGRIERAAALLALSRPRVAFVELKRALAINPTNRRAMRLLGKVYVDAGAPSRAAELLAQRFKTGDVEEEVEPTHVTLAPERIERAADLAADTELLDKTKRESAASPISPSTPPEARPAKWPDAPRPTLPSQLFSDLTRDLGLATPDLQVSRVEVTQIIRRRQPNRPRSPSELAVIDGPIVDTTQPGQLQETSQDLPSPPMGHEPPPLFDAVTSPRLQLAPFGLDDEPLFQEHMPFAVRPVEAAADGTDPLGDLRETIDEELPPEFESSMRAALQAQPPVRPSGSAPNFSGEALGDTLVDQLEEVSGPLERLPSSPQPPPLELPGPDARAELDPARPVVELQRPGRRALGAFKIEIISPPAKRSHVVFAVLGGLLMFAYLVLLAWNAPDAWAPSFLRKLRASEGQAAGEAGGSKDRGAASERREARPPTAAVE